ncbi:glycosyltransferase involved in cell wall biosynthesis [Sporosarcina luteola]|nr:glycosyltransferase involved in cell wall biosynthesis [Sporosarcina luteola]
MQTFKDFELIIVDDGSTDSTAKIIKQYDDPRIRIIQHEKNKGVATARNTGYRISRGEYIVISDSDDINLPTKIEEQVNLLDTNPEIDVVGCQYQVFNEEGFGAIYPFSESNEYIRCMQVFGNDQAPASMFRKEKIEKLGLLFHDESFPAAVDTNWFSKLPRKQ